MRIAGRTADRGAETVLCLCVLLAAGCAWASPPAAAPAAGTTLTAGNPAPALHGILELDGPWRFQIGDDPQWANPGFDDSSWPAVTLGKALSDQGFESYAGYGWYRLHLRPEQLHTRASGTSSLQLLVTSHSVGQLAVYINGFEVGHTQGMTDRPKMYQSSPFIVPVPPAGTGDMVVAIRSWAAPGIPITHGLLERVEAGAPPDVADRLALATARHWDQDLIAGLVLSLLFLGVAGLGAILYLAQRHHSEYLWLTLLCVSVSLIGGSQIAHGLALMPTGVFDVVNLWTGRIFMAVTLEFIVRFTASEHRRLVRIAQIAVLVSPVVSLLGLQAAHQVISIAGEVVFCALVTMLLFQAWRRGLHEAGVMLLPFFLAATADSIDTVLGYLAYQHWIPERFAGHRFHLGPIEFTTSDVTYGVFLGSLMAVILYRFVRVSQEEQRSNAEIAAARSVQAMLIPTEMPSNNHFLLESAYIPVNGVGGDFFQVLPVEDGSMMIVVGDVSGKGLQAAMNASTLVGAFRNELSHEPATILSHLNNVLLGATTGPGGTRSKDSVVSFATCLCARVYRDGTMEIANAGHLSPYRDGREMELPAGLPLGIVPAMTYEQATFQLQQGERLIFLSDGVVEATNDRGELFGFERTQQVSNEPARYIAQTAKRFGQNDDITVISLYMVSRETKHAAKTTALAPPAAPSPAT
jgi:hypothetical protein